MFKSILSYFWKDSSPEKAFLPLDEAFKVISECEDEDPPEITPNEEVINEDLKSYEVSTKIGKITSISDDTYTVDDLHSFKSDRDDISVGTKISYQLINDKGELTVVNVEVEDDWDVTIVGTKAWHARTYICNVSDRQGRVLILKPGDIKADLNKVSSAFIPIVGDWLQLDVKCESNEKVVDLSGKIIEISKIQPLRAQLKLGLVSNWDPDTCTGVVDKNIFFNGESLLSGYIPIRGDKVAVEIIESNQGNCTWRALKIVPDYLGTKDNTESIKENNKEEDCVDTHKSVTITGNVNLTFMKLGERKAFIMEIESHEEIQLVCIEVPKFNGQCCLSNNIDHYDLKINQPLTTRFDCIAKRVGESSELIIFHFKDFKIKRRVNINVTTNEPNNGKTYTRIQKPLVSRMQRKTIHGQTIVSARFIPLHMPHFEVPKRLYDLVSNYRQQTNQLRVELEKIKPCLVSSLSYMNYEDKFHTLLHLDEIYVLNEMQNYDQERACFVKSGEYLMLEIENLAERRPSVIQGDRVIARSLTNPNAPNYEGIIHKTGKNHAYIKFSELFHNIYDGEDYSIYIEASRMSYKRKHFAVKLAVQNLGKDFLFPSKIVEKEPQLEFIFDDYVDSINSPDDDSSRPKPPDNKTEKEKLLEKIRKFRETKGETLPAIKLEWYNDSLNFYQKEAVRNALLGVCRPLPYIIFGPPGTGKTVTIVEAVLQILRLMPHSRILLCAPSNSAADLLALRLIDSGVLKPGDLVRLVAVAAIGSIPARLAPYCATGNLEREGTETAIPVVTPSGLVLGYSSSVLGRHRITVSTCSNAGLLYSMGFSKGHFSHVIVDEAGQTSEPGVLIPLAFLDVSSGQTILAGDPRQLGPVVLYQIAADYGLEESFLERMVNRFPYIRDTHGFPNTFGYDSRLITKLIYNYRSLPALLKLPSMLFYNDDLKATISEDDSKEAMVLRKLQEILPRGGKNSPILFHGVIGKNYQNEDSPSWFNPSEAAQAFHYVNELYRLGLNAEDVGIITPYKAQTKQLMELFKEAEFNLPKVGTVEEFQGQEFNVIILSTVRSQQKYLHCDIKHTMGFISSPRRLNVSITRAKCLLIIVGNPELLATDRCWRSVINYCTEKNSFIDCSKEN